MGRPPWKSRTSRTHGPAWRQAQHAHLSLGQRKVMSAIEQSHGGAGDVLRCMPVTTSRLRTTPAATGLPKCQARARNAAGRTAGAPGEYYQRGVPCGESPPSPYQQSTYLSAIRGGCRDATEIAGDARHLGAQIGVTWCCILGARHGHTIPMCTALCRVAAYRPMVNAGGLQPVLPVEMLSRWPAFT